MYKEITVYKEYIFYVIIRKIKALQMLYKLIESKYLYKTGGEL